MDLGKAVCHRKTAVNYFHHDQVFHPDYGLVWHNGTSVFLSSGLQVHKQTATAITPPITLGRFENVEGVYWSATSHKHSGEISSTYFTVDSSYLCVQHAGSISIWTVSGRSLSLKCQKQSEHKMKALPQGCLWHPVESILCALSDKEIHVYNASTSHWKTMQCDGKISAGCWVTDGSKFILATGSRVNVYMFNQETHTIYLASSGANSTQLKSSDTSMHIKTMVAISEDLVAIATDLPLDSLICRQTQHNLLDGTSTNPDTVTESDLIKESSTPEFSLIIPKDCIVQNPVAEIFKDDERQTPKICIISDEGKQTDVCLEASAASPEDKTSPSADTLGDKLDQILNLMKKMDSVPDVRKGHFNKQGKKHQSTVRSKLESTMQETSRQGLIDVTSMISDLDELYRPLGDSVQSPVQNLSLSNSYSDRSESLKFDKQSENDSNESLHDRNSCQVDKLAIVQGKSHTEVTESSSSTHVVTDPNDVTLSDLKQENLPVDLEGRLTDSGNKSLAGVSGSSQELTKRVQNELSRRQSGPVDVTTLLALNSVAERTEDQEHLMKGSIPVYGELDLKSVAERTNKQEDSRDRTFDGTGDDDKDEEVESDANIIDLTGLKADSNHGSDAQQTMSKTNMTNSSDTAKLMLLRVSAFKNPATVASVDLPGILTPDLLCFQKDSRQFVVGTNAQKQLLVYTLWNNTLKPATENIILPDSHRPLGLCSISDNPSANILILSGESHSSATENSFLSFSSEIQLNLKLFSFQLQMYYKTNNGIGSNCVLPMAVKSEQHNMALESNIDQETPADISSDSTPRHNLNSSTKVSHTIQMSSAKHLVKQTDDKSSYIAISSSPTLQTSSQNIPISHTSDSKTPAQTFFSSPIQGLHLSHRQGSPTAAHRPVGSKTSKRWSWSMGQRPWSSSHRTTSSKEDTVGPAEDHTHKNTGRNTSTAMKYPYPEYADLLHIVCKGSKDTPVEKSFLLNQKMIKLQIVKDVFQLDMVEMKIGDHWVVLTEDSDGYIPMCFSASTRQTIRSVNNVINKQVVDVT